MITKHKVLIIKLGHSETLDPIISKECSLGDVVRTTVILNYFNEGDSITWLVDEKAEPLLLGNPRLKRVMRWSLENYVQLKNELFDVVINLEKHPGICAFADELKARQKYGFYFGIWSGKAEAHFHTEKVLEIVEVPSIREKNKQYWQEHLARVINKRWSIKDRYIMIEPTKSKGEGIIGLNHEVGSKWPTKGWESWKWKELNAKLLELGYKTSWQTGFDNLSTYMDWVASCDCIVTCDSLGLHLAIAYGKRVISLFGPSPSQEVYLYGQGAIVDAPTRDMSRLTVETVLETVKGVFPLDSATKRQDTSKKSST